MDHLAPQLAAVLGMTALTVLMHLLGLMGLLRLTSIHIKHWRTPWLQLDRLLVPVLMVTALFVVHALEVGAYALLFWWVQAVPDLESAIYLSAGAYSTAGWVGLEPADGWRVLAALESLNGMLLIGWSTAFLFQTLHRILATEENHPLPEGAIAPESDDAPEPDAKGVD